MTKDDGELLPRKQEQDKMEKDFEMFLRDVEEDSELRNTLAIYKAKKDKTAMEGIETASMAETEGSDDVPKINMAELLDDFDDLDIRE